MTNIKELAKRISCSETFSKIEAPDYLRISKTHWFKFNEKNLWIVKGENQKWCCYIFREKAYYVLQKDFTFIEAKIFGCNELEYSCVFELEDILEGLNLCQK